MVYYRLRANIISSIVSVEGIALSPTGRTAKSDVCAGFDTIGSLLAEGYGRKGVNQRGSQENRYSA